MKRILQCMLALVLSCSLLTIPQGISVIAKQFNDYSYTILQDGTVEITNYNGDEEILSIPSQIEGKDVTSIGYGAFAECRSLVKVTIPKTVKVLGFYAFSKCTKMEEVVLPDGILTLGKNAFASNINLKKINLPSSLKSIGYGSFFDCLALEDISIPDSILSIEGMAFSGCKSLKNINFPSSITNIGSSAFEGCINFTELNLPENLTNIGSSAFAGCINLKDVQFPEGLIGIGQSAFKDCISLTELHIPDNVEGIGYAAFSGCSSLAKINIPPLVSVIANSTFSGCGKLASIEIPSTIKEIGEYAFSGCNGLTDLYIPDSVEIIGMFAFSYCGELENIRLPAGNSKFDTMTVGLFTDCVSLKSVVIPDGVKLIEDTVFSGCTNLLSVVIPNSVAELGSRVFSNANKVVVSVANGSEAHTYARKNNVKFSLIEQGFNLPSDSIMMKVNEETILSVVIYPYNIADNSKLIWSVDNPAVARVDANGKVTAVGVGSTTLTVRNTGGQSASMKIEVNDVKIPITSLYLNKESTVLRKGSAEGLRASITPNDTTDSKTLTWESSDTTIATVNAMGVITGRAVGTATITVKTSNGLTKKCEVTVISEIKEVTLNQTAMSLEVDQHQTLRASISPSDTTDDKTLSWSTSNPNVATVSQDGTVTAKNIGYATISVQSKNGRSAVCKIVVTKPVDIPISSITLNPTSLSLEEGKTATIQATINPSNTTQSKVLDWTVDDPEVAEVDQNGKVTALAEGTATITVTASNNVVAGCVVTVTKESIEISSVELNVDKLDLVEGESETLVATINPENATADTKLTWNSSDPTVATVDQNGAVTAIKEGTTTVTVTTSNKKSAQAVITVSKKTNEIQSVSLNKTSLTLFEYAEDTLVATIHPSDTTQDKTLTWSSDNPQVAIVDASGKVLAKKAGTTTIRVTTSNKKQASCTITVVESDAKQNLKSLVNEYSSVDTDDYETANQASFKEALNAANSLLDQASYVSDAEYVSAYDNLKAAFLAMVKLPANTEGLKEVVTITTKPYEQASKYEKSAAWNAYVSAYDAAQKALQSDSKKEVEQAMQKLCDAYADIRLIPSKDALEALKKK